MARGGFQPGNYSVKFMECMAELEAHDMPRKMPQTFANVRWLIEKMKTAQHFQLPDEGKLLELDNMPDFMPLLLHPPFPVTVLEYAVHREPKVRDFYSVVESTRRIALAIDAAEGFPPHLITKEQSDLLGEGVAVFPICYVDKIKRWVPPQAMMFYNYDQAVGTISLEQYDRVERKVGYSWDEVRGQRTLTARLAVLSPEMATSYAGGFAEYLSGIAEDARDEVRTYMNFCVALGCSNVTTERIPAAPGLNRMRARARKHPLFDYHVLALRGGDEHGAGDGGGGAAGSGRSVRPHLRRGHIRRLASGKIVWINATLVHGSAAGFVAKDYRLDPDDA
jgi:hypothetical protein